MPRLQPLVVRYADDLVGYPCKSTLDCLSDDSTRDAELPDEREAVRAVDGRNACHLPGESADDAGLRRVTVEYVERAAAQAAKELSRGPRIPDRAPVPARPIEPVDGQTGGSSSVGDRRYSRCREFDLPAKALQLRGELVDILRNAAVRRLEGEKHATHPDSDRLE